VGNDTTKTGYKPYRLRHKPTVIEGFRYDGTVACATAIVAWGHRRTGNTPFRIEMDDLVADTPQGPRYIPENWLAVLGVIGEPYSIQPEVEALAYEPATNPGFGAPIPIDRVRELVAEAHRSPDRERLRDIIRELGARCEETG
jgi:hypothetical protein